MPTYAYYICWQLPVWWSTMMCKYEYCLDTCSLYVSVDTYIRRKKIWCMETGIVVKIHVPIRDHPARTARTGQTGQDCLNRLAWQVSLEGEHWKNKDDKTARTWKLHQENSGKGGLGRAAGIQLDRTDGSRQKILDRTSGTRQLGQKSDTVRTGQVSLLSEN
jgi:hypothetical protein